MESNGLNFDLKEEIRAYWSARASTFDDSASHKIEDQFGKPNWQAFLRQAMGLAPDEDMQGLHVLDLACSTGEISQMLCNLGAEVTGLGFSETMHSFAKAKLEGKTWKPLLCDAENLATVVEDGLNTEARGPARWQLPYFVTRACT
jgi:ubiquinone/menaquinone biosynthesis C-methylase UbiE